MRATTVYPNQAPGLSTAHNCTLTAYHGGQYAELRPPTTTVSPLWRWSPRTGYGLLEVLQA